MISTVMITRSISLRGCLAQTYLVAISTDTSKELGSQSVNVRATTILLVGPIRAHRLTQSIRHPPAAPESVAAPLIRAERGFTGTVQERLSQCPLPPSTYTVKLDAGERGTVVTRHPTLFQSVPHLQWIRYLQRSAVCQAASSAPNAYREGPSKRSCVHSVQDQHHCKPLWTPRQHRVGSLQWAPRGSEYIGDERCS